MAAESLSALSAYVHLFNSNLACSVAKVSKGSNLFVKLLISAKKVSNGLISLVRDLCGSQLSRIVCTNEFSIMQ